MAKKILFINGAVGLGHIARGLAIAGELRRQIPDVELFWLANAPAKTLLKNVGEMVLPESEHWADQTSIAEKVASNFQMNLIKHQYVARKDWARNVEIFKQVTDGMKFDLIVGDDAFEISIALRKREVVIEPTVVMIYDFIGIDSATKNPLEKLGVYYWNRRWALSYEQISKSDLTFFFAGEEEDVADRPFDLLLPNRRDWARRHCRFLGYILGFDPAEYVDRNKVRDKLGYGTEPLIICSIGGTSIGKSLLELCGQAFPIIKREIPAIRMVLVCGPRIPPESLEVPQGVEVKGYVPALYEHFAACDLAIVHGGGISTLELTALRRPFLYFPIEGQFEQQISVARRLARHRAGVKMRFSRTTPELLADSVIDNLGAAVNYARIPTDGAQKAVHLIKEIIESG
jgi:UDP:flavonoid glycosyltransferase YjiC (YdhE family)